ncbi:MAG: hypothetical protein ACFE0R_18530 [Salinarimonas sp.]
MRPLTTASAALVAGLVTTSAFAVDLGPLRGGYGAGGLEPVVSWQGGYFAGFGGQSNGSLNASGTLSELVGNAMRRTQIETEMQVSSWLNPNTGGASDTSFGVLAGYNFQFSEAILGVEMDATFGTLRSAGSDTLSRFQTTSNGYTNFVTATGSVSAKL